MVSPTVGSLNMPAMPVGVTPPAQTASDIPVSAADLQSAIALANINPLSIILGNVPSASSSSSTISAVSSALNLNAGVAGTPSTDAFTPSFGLNSVLGVPTNTIPPASSGQDAIQAALNTVQANPFATLSARGSNLLGPLGLTSSATSSPFGIPTASTASSSPFTINLMIGPSQPAMSDTQALQTAQANFDTLDANKDGMLSSTEMMAGGSGLSALAQKIPELMFANIETTKNAYTGVSKQDLQLVQDRVSKGETLSAIANGLRISTAGSRNMSADVTTFMNYVRGQRLLNADRVQTGVSNKQVVSVLQKYSSLLDTAGGGTPDGIMNLQDLKNIVTSQPGTYPPDLVVAAFQFINNPTLAAKLDNGMAGVDSQNDGIFSIKELELLAADPNVDTY
jgi:hypothetical protein